MVNLANKHSKWFYDRPSGLIWWLNRERNMSTSQSIFYSQFHHQKVKKPEHSSRSGVNDRITSQAILCTITNPLLPLPQLYILQTTNNIILLVVCWVELVNLVIKWKYAFFAFLMHNIIGYDEMESFCSTIQLLLLHYFFSLTKTWATCLNVQKSDVFMSGSTLFLSPKKWKQRKHVDHVHKESKLCTYRVFLSCHTLSLVSSEPKLVIISFFMSEVIKND